MRACTGQTVPPNINTIRLFLFWQHVAFRLDFVCMPSIQYFVNSGCSFLHLSKFIQTKFVLVNTLFFFDVSSLNDVKSQLCALCTFSCFNPVMHSLNYCLAAMCSLTATGFVTRQRSVTTL